MNASDSTPHPFNSSETINGASMLSVFNFGHIPKLRDKRPTWEASQEKKKLRL